MSENKRYIYNYYHSRGYAITRSADGKHSPAKDHSGGGEYGAVGCSLGLPNSVMDVFVSSPYLFFDSNATERRSSLYLYPRFGEAKGHRFAVIGQTVTHEKNFLSSSPNFFSHNLIIAPADLNAILSTRAPHIIFEHNFKDTYVDGNSAVQENELACDNCIDSPIELEAFVRKTNRQNAIPRLSRELARAIVLSVVKPDTHLVICMDKSPEEIDYAAREVLQSIYYWLPQKVLQNMGFLTNWNGAKVPESCKLIFCPRQDIRKLQTLGLGSIRANSTIYIDAGSPMKNLPSEKQMGVTNSDIEYINWLCSCIAGEFTSDDIQLRTTIDEYEVKIAQRIIPFAACSRIYNSIISQKNYHKDMNEENARSFGVTAFALLNTFATQIQNDFEKIFPLVGSDLKKIISNNEIDSLLLDIDTRFPNLLDSLTPYLGADIGEYISYLRIYKSSLRSLKEICRTTDSNETVKLVIEGAKHKYRDGSYEEDESAFGYDICLLSLERFGWSKEIQLLCKDLLTLSFTASKKNNRPVFREIRNIGDFIRALRVIRLSNGSVDINDCERIILDSTLHPKKKPNDIVLSFLENGGVIPHEDWATPLTKVLALYIMKLSLSDSYTTDTIKRFADRLAPTEKYSDEWVYFSALLAQLFTKATAEGEDAVRVFDSIAAIKMPESCRKSYSIGVSQALTLLLSTYAATEKANKVRFKELQNKFVDVYRNTFEDCCSESITEPANAIIQILRKSSISKINGFEVSSDISNLYQQVPIRERATILENVCHSIADTPEYVAFWDKLGIARVPVYVKWGGTRGAVENIYRAFVGDEYRDSYIEDRLKELSKDIDLVHVGAFTNDASSKGVSFGDLLVAKKDDGKLFSLFSTNLRELIANNISSLYSSETDYCNAWKRYIGLIANVLFYRIEEAVGSCDIRGIVLRNDNIDFRMGVLSNICKELNAVKTFADEHSSEAEALFNKLRSIISENLRSLENGICSDTLPIDPYVEISSLITTNTLNDALQLFPNAIDYLIRLVESGRGAKTKASKVMLSNKLYPGRNDTYCSDRQIDERLHIYLRKHPKSNKATWISIAAALVLITGIGLVLPQIMEKPNTNIVQVEPEPTWEYTIVDKDNLAYYDTISDSAQHGQIEQLYRLSIKDATSSSDALSGSDLVDSNVIRTTNSMAFSDSDTFGKYDKYVRVLMAYVRPVYDSDDQKIEIIETEEKTISITDDELLVVSGSDITVRNDIFDNKNVSDCDVYIAVLGEVYSHYEAYNGPYGYPTLEDAIADTLNAPVIETIEGDGLDRRINTISLYKDIEINETIEIHNDIVIKTGVDSQIVVNRSSNFGDEFFLVEEDASLSLNGVVLDGGAEWVTSPQTEEPLLPDIDISMHLNYDRGKPGDKLTPNGEHYALHVVAKNSSSYDIEHLSFDILYDSTQIDLLKDSSDAEKCSVVFCTENIMDHKIIDDQTIRFAFQGGNETTSDSNVADTKSDTIPAGGTIEFDVFFEIKESAIIDSSTSFYMSEIIAYPPAQANDLHLEDNAPEAEGDFVDISNASEQPTQFFNYGDLTCTELIISQKADTRIASIVATINEQELSVDNADGVFCVNVDYDLESIDFRIGEQFNQFDSLSMEISGGPSVLSYGKNNYTLKVTGGSEQTLSEREYSLVIILNKDYNITQPSTIVEFDYENEGIIAHRPIVVCEGYFALDKDSCIQNNYVVSDEYHAGAIMVEENGKAELCGSVRFNGIIMEESECSGAIWNSGEVVVTNSGCINSNYSHSRGTAVGAIYNEGALCLQKDAEISNNIATEVGGILNSGEASISNARILSNHASNTSIGVGGISNIEGQLTISDDSVISLNSATYVGGIDNSAELILWDCIIENNIANSSDGYGGVHSDDNGETTISGAAVVTMNQSSEGIESDLYAQNPIIVNSNTPQAVIGLTKYEPGESFAKLETSTPGLEKMYVGCFFCDGDQGPKIISDGKMLRFTSDEDASEYYVIDSLCEENGTISFVGTRRAFNGQEIYYEITPNEYYEVSDILVNGKSFVEQLENNGSILHLSDISEESVIVVTFRRIQCKLSIECNDLNAGNIIIQPDMLSDIVDAGTIIELIVEPAEGYELFEFVVNDRKYIVDNMIDEDGKYRSSLRVTKDTTIMISFAQQEQEVSPPESGETPEKDSNSND